MNFILFLFFILKKREVKGNSCFQLQVLFCLFSSAQNRLNNILMQMRSLHSCICLTSVYLGQICKKIFGFLLQLVVKFSQLNLFSFHSHASFCSPFYFICLEKNNSVTRQLFGERKNVEIFKRESKEKFHSSKLVVFRASLSSDRVKKLWKKV